ncbi:MAG: chorismate mutase [Alphaproteobacteria bacterium]|nr:chorismate mutase [Alphaproteobacteria bacterium]MBL7099520.1 chorismate mutase [Alphaproteobacteria bacterium]
MCRSAQWKPSAYLLRALKGWNAVTNPASRCRNMTELRAEIDRLDLALVALLAERQTYIERAAEIKTSRAVVHDQARIDDVIGKVVAAAKTAGLSLAIAEPVWRTLIDRCIAHEFEMFDRKVQAAAR